YTGWKPVPQLKSSRPPWVWVKKVKRNEHANQNLRHHEPGRRASRRCGGRGRAGLCFLRKERAEHDRSRRGQNHQTIAGNRLARWGFCECGRGTGFARHWGMRLGPAAVSRRRTAGILHAVRVDEHEGLSHPRRRIAEGTSPIPHRGLAARRIRGRKSRRHGRKIQLGPGRRGAKIRQTHFPGWRTDAGKCRRRRTHGATIWRGRCQRRGIVTREKGPRQSARVHRQRPPGGEKMKRIAVFCGSNKGTRAAYAEAAENLGRQLARRGIELVYGGGCVGLMGILADAALKNGGHVIGVIPEKLVIKEVVHEKLPDLRVVKNMHERKALMAELADGFIALPG